MKYKYLEHTADIKFQAYGKSLEQAFGNAALALSNVIVDTKNVKKKIKKTIEVEGEDLKSLLYNFLEEFLFLLDTENFLLSKVNNIKINKKNNNYELTAIVSGDNVINYKTKGDVKAVTYNEMEIKQEKNKVMLQVVLDV